MSRFEQGFTVSVAAFVGAFLALGVLGGYPWRVLEFPLLVGATVMALCVVSLRSGRRAAPSGDGTDGETGTGLAPARDWRGALWAVASLAFATVLGYALGLAAYALLSARLFGRSWRASLATGVVTLVVVQAGFGWLMGLPLPRGLIAMG